MDEITDGFWTKTHDLRMPGGIYFNTRMSIVDIGDGKLLLHSPIPIDDELALQIDGLGEIRWIIAPNDLHHVFLPAAAERYPDAEVWGTSGARDKETDVVFTGLLDEEMPEWDDAVEGLYVPGTRGWGETVYYLPVRRTLLCSDLVFNIHETVNLRTKWLLKFVGAHERLAQSAAVKWLFARDVPAVGEAFARILDWDFDRVVMGHGRVVEENGRERIAPLLEWAIAKRRPAIEA